MKQQSLISRLIFTSLAFLLLFTLNLSAQSDAVNGKKLFNQNCAACHKLDGKSIGPELGGITEQRENEWLLAWIKDNAAFQKVDKDAKAAAEFSPVSMTAFAYLSDQEINDILEYTATPPPPPPTKGPEGGAPVVEADNTMLYILIAIMFVMVLIIFNLSRTISELRGDAEGSRSLGDLTKDVWSAFKRNKFLHFLMVIFFLLFGAYATFGYLMQVGVDEGYQPIQPIAFNHAIHAGDNKIDCQYCHSSAKHSKTSGIPSANVCMNCHMSISEYNGELFGDYTKEDLDGEIQKIYDAVGWDKDNLAYIEGYEKKPIQWVRIHNLPDFAYYNHSQHVTVAGLECQKCHGPVEEMEEVYQYSPLTMEWCINCHRETEIDMTENGYYKKIHEQLAEKYGYEDGLKSVTEAEMGGMECGKCHY